MTAGPLCLPKLSGFALYLKRDADETPYTPYFVADPAPVAPHHGPDVCSALGALVTSGVLPALAQARASLPQQQPPPVHARGSEPAPPSLHAPVSPLCMAHAPGPAVPLQMG